MNTKLKVYISLWWLMQLCGLILVTRHLGHLLVDVLLLSSIVGFAFGGRKVSIVSSFGLASYAALTFIGAALICFLTCSLSNYRVWLLAIFAMVIAILNLIISFITKVSHLPFYRLSRIIKHCNILIDNLLTSRK